MFVLNFQLRIFQDFPTENFWSAIGEKKIHFGIGNGALFQPQIKQNRNTGLLGCLLIFQKAIGCALIRACPCTKFYSRKTHVKMLKITTVISQVTPVVVSHIH